MKLLPDEWISLTLTSPPYNIGKAYEQNLPLEVYLDWCEQWISEVYRMTLPTGSFGLLPMSERGE